MPRLGVWARRATTRGVVFIRSHRVVVKNALCGVSQFRRGACPGCIGRLTKGIFVVQRTLVKVMLTGPKGPVFLSVSLGAHAADHLAKATIHVGDLCADASGQVAEQKGGDIAHIVDGNVALDSC